jgi:hypothetical protein
MTLLSPKEMINTTHEDKFFLNGNGYRYSELTLFNDSTEERIPIKLQKIGQFQQYTSLIIGKNRFRLVDARKDAEIIYPFTVIRTHAYRDTKNEDFNQMATLGILDPTPLLKPALPTTKGAALLWLARLKEVRIENVDSDSPAWWKAVNQLALKEHWIEKIDDDRVLKRKEAMLLMTRVLGIDVFDILTDTTHARNISSQNPDAKLVTWFIEHGMMPAGNTNLNEPVQRAEFANWLRRTDVGVYRISKYFETN